MNILSDNIILKTTNDFIIINKPAGCLTIPGRDPHSTKPVLRQWLTDKLKQNIYVVHRLDEGTTGIQVFALNADIHQKLSMAFENGEVKKTYVAVIETGTKNILNQVIDAPILKLKSKKNKSVVSIKQGKPSQTIVRELESKNGLSLIEATPLTGRTHQIRVHLNYLGFPLLGDKTYGGKPSWGNIKLPYPVLHAKSLEFFEEKFEAPTPSLFQDLGF